jgi:hypothetical protein
MQVEFSEFIEIRMPLDDSLAEYVGLPPTSTDVMEVLGAMLWLAGDACMPNP